MQRLEVLESERELELIAGESKKAGDLLGSLRVLDEKKRETRKKISSIRSKFAAVEASVKELRKTSNPVRSRMEDSAIVLQRAWRRYDSREKLRSLFNSIVKRYKDEETGKVYYVNTRTNKTSWSKPVFYGSKKPRNPSQAAVLVQRRFRRKMARRIAQAAMAKRFIKVFDRKRSAFYYQNTYTLRVSWKKPTILGDAEIREFVPSAESVKKQKHRQEEKKAEGESSRMKVEVVEEHQHSCNTPWTDVKGSSAARSRSLTEEEAARKLQSLWRYAKARKIIMSVIRARFQKVYDEKQQAWYYFDKSTKTSSWSKPKLLKRGDLQATTEFGIEDVGGEGEAKTALAESNAAVEKEGTVLKEEKGGEQKEEKEKAEKKAPLTKEEAAVAIAQTFRRYKARKMVLALVSARFQKVWSEEHKAFFYFDQKSGRSVWKKPSLLREGDIKATPRSEALSAGLPAENRTGKEKAALAQSNAALEKEGTVLKEEKGGEQKEEKEKAEKKAPLTKEEAAVAIAQTFRRYKARKMVLALVSARFQKVWSEEHKAFFYFDQKSGRSVWKKPSLLREGDIKATPRSEALSAGLPVEARDEEEGRSKANEKTETVAEREKRAATLISRVFRRYKARKLVLAIIAARWEKVWDPESSSFFYYDSKEGNSSWERPALLRGSDIEATPRSQAKSTKAPVSALTGIAKKGENVDKASIETEVESRAKVEAETEGEAKVEAEAKTETKDGVGLKAEAKAEDNAKDMVESKVKSIQPAQEKPTGDAESKSIETALTPEQASILISGAWRRYKARKRILFVIAQRFEKVFDPSSGTFYYYDVSKGTSSWSKPSLLKESDIEATPRSKALSLQVPKGISGAVIDESQAKLVEADATVVTMYGGVVHEVDEEGQSLHESPKVEVVATATEEAESGKLIVEKTIEKQESQGANLEGASSTTGSLVRDSTVTADGSSRASLEKELGREKELKDTAKFDNGLDSKVEGGEDHKEVDEKKNAQSDEGAVAMQANTVMQQEKRVAQACAAAEVGGKEDGTNEISDRSTEQLSKLKGPETGIDEGAVKEEHDVTSSEAKEEEEMRATEVKEEVDRPAEAKEEKADAKMHDDKERTNSPVETKKGKRGTSEAEVEDLGDKGTSTSHDGTSDDSKRNSTVTATKSVSESDRGGKEPKVEQTSGSPPPKLSNDSKEVQINYTAEHHTAATRIQAAFRARKASLNVQEVLRLVWEHVVEADGVEYFYNSRTGNSSWTAPSILRDGTKLLSPEARQRMVDKKQRGTWKSAGVMNNGEAATAIQSVFRMRKARRTVFAVACTVFEKVLDVDSGSAYYYNTRTGESTWTKPSVFGSGDIDFTPRSAAEAAAGTRPTEEFAATR